MTVDALEAAFQGSGLVVSRNTPFAGAYIAQHYGCLLYTSDAADE